MSSEQTESKNSPFLCKFCKKSKMFKTRRQVMHHLTRDHKGEISKEEYLKIRKIVRTIEQGHQEGVLIF